MSDEEQAEAQQAPEMPETGIDKDALINLPYPLMLATIGNRFNVVARIFDNKGAHLSIVDITNLQTLAGCTIGFGMAPEGVEVHDHWTAILNDAGQKLWQALVDRNSRTIVAPQKKLHLVGANGAAH
jgi:hypothetical protein